MARRRPERFVEPRFLGGDAAGLGGTVMWVLDFCVKHSSECVHMAENALTQNRSSLACTCQGVGPTRGRSRVQAWRPLGQERFSLLDR